jgi:hypothetical protein
MDVKARIDIDPILLSKLSMSQGLEYTLKIISSKDKNSQEMLKVIQK